MANDGVVIVGGGLVGMATAYYLHHSRQRETTARLCALDSPDARLGRDRP
jgi:glycine/D-amino acid oxidase-like deaminating enzyme